MLQPESAEWPSVYDGGPLRFGATGPGERFGARSIFLDGRSRDIPRCTWATDDLEARATSHRSFPQMAHS